MHVWDEKGKPTIEIRTFNKLSALIRSRCNIIMRFQRGLIIWPAKQRSFRIIKM